MQARDRDARTNETAPRKWYAGTGRRRALTALVLAVLAGGVVLVFAGGNYGDDTRELPAGYFRDRLLDCLPAEQSQGAYAAAGVTGCLRETLLDAEKLANLQTAREDLGALVAERPWLHNYCHLAEHQTGALIMRDPARVPALLLAHPGNTCSWGIGHGLLETFGAARPDENLWGAVIDTCRSLRTLPDPYPEVYALCADGIGHAAWDHHRELRGAVARCEALDETSAVSSCTTGIMMQQYRPAETGEQPELDPRELERYCQDRWPSTKPESLEGCATGIGYVLSLSLVGDRVSESLSRNGTGDIAQRAAASAAAEGVAAGGLVCASLGALDATCRASLVTNLPTHLITDKAAWATLCSGAGDALRTNCEALRQDD